MSIWSVTSVKLINNQSITSYLWHILTLFSPFICYSGAFSSQVKYFSSFPLYSAEYMGLGYGDSSLLQFTLWFWVQWCAVVWLVRRHVPRETQTLVGPFCVNAFGILAEGHPVVQLVALIHICKKETSKDICTLVWDVVNNHLVPALLGLEQSVQMPWELYFQFQLDGIRLGQRL